MLVCCGLCCASGGRGVETKRISEKIPLITLPYS
jgi:hypothetical protein